MKTATKIMNVHKLNEYLSRQTGAHSILLLS